VYLRNEEKIFTEGAKLSALAILKDDDDHHQQKMTIL
jgi:hypothetical protein